MNHGETDYDAAFADLIGDAEIRRKRRSEPSDVSPVGARVMLMLTRLGWTLKDLANRMDCSPQNLSNILRSQNIRRRSVERLATALGTRPDLLDPRFLVPEKKKTQGG